MKDSYLCINNINDETQQTDITKMVLDSNFKLLGDNNKDAMLKQFKSEVENAKSSAELFGINTFEIDCNESAGLERWNKSHMKKGGIGSSSFI